MDDCRMSAKAFRMESHRPTLANASTRAPYVTAFGDAVPSSRVCATSATHCSHREAVAHAPTAALIPMMSGSKAANLIAPRRKTTSPQRPALFPACRATPKLMASGYTRFARMPCTSAKLTSHLAARAHAAIAALQLATADVALEAVLLRERASASGQPNISANNEMTSSQRPAAPQTRKRALSCIAPSTAQAASPRTWALASSSRIASPHRQFAPRSQASSATL
mmetsp:Transcript_39569/g.109015  ORF Transcript_39569/g.109015 Transcript_39569/m.109015 type:complete len:225 (-) Transcript_39569:601-1275(-)